MRGSLRVSSHPPKPHCQREIPLSARPQLVDLCLPAGSLGLPLEDTDLCFVGKMTVAEGTWESLVNLTSHFTLNLGLLNGTLVIRIQ